jgi:hypothetical protein
MNIILTLFLLVLVGYLGFLLTQYLNRNIASLINEAKTKASQRRLRQKAQSIDKFVESNVSPEHERHIYCGLAKGLSSIFGVNDRFPFDSEEKLGNVFRVNKSEIELNKAAWKKAGLKDFIEVYSDELLSMTLTVVGKEKFNTILETIDDVNSEDSFKDYLMDMTVGQYLSFFSIHDKTKLS